MSPPLVRLALLLALVAFAAPALAQPAPDAVVGAWRRGWREAVRTVDRVESDEALTRRVEGPRGTVTVETRATISFAPRGGGPPDRRLLSATVDGETVDPDRLAALNRRLARAFGGGFDETARTPHLLPAALDRGEPVRLDLDTVDGRPAWRVALRMAPGRPPGGGHPPRGSRRPPPPRDDRAEAWFTRSTDAPRLLRVRVEGERPGGGAFVRTVDFERTDGLDLPVAMNARVEVRQRRRLRVYATTVTAEARYSRPTVER